MRLTIALSYLFTLIFASAETVPSAAISETELLDSVLRIEVATQVSDYRTPWAAGGFSGGQGTGFLIGPNQILTNAHVIANARRVLVTMRNSARKLPATVVHIADDCDLALVALDDPAPLAKLKGLPISETMPALDSEVRAIGYPVGGDRLSVSRGIVSRIDFQPYSHSRADSHLIIQVDAAINPGNSGGPAIQKDQVIGVAFQGLRAADNTGYIIPTPVIQRFLKDIEDGHYDEYVDIGITEFSLFNPAMRRALGLPDDDRGVLVTSVIPTGPCDGVLEVNDILMSIDDKPIDSAGNIEVDGEQLNLNEVVERKFAGDVIKLEFLRKGELKSAEATLVTVPASRIYAATYGKRPRYIFYAGLVLQPLDLNVFSAHRIDSLNVRKTFADYISEGLFQKRPDMVTITRIEMDELTADLGQFEETIIETINGTPVRDLKHAYELLYSGANPEFTVIECEGMSRPLVIPTAKVAATNERLMKVNNIQRTHYLGE